MGLSGTDDATVLAWAATEDRLFVTHDRKTIPVFAVARTLGGQWMPGVVVVAASCPLRVALMRCSFWSRQASRANGRGRSCRFPSNGGLPGPGAAAVWPVLDIKDAPVMLDVPFFNPLFQPLYFSFGILL